ncbi:MAG: NAD-dependent epimerase/dehydratase family protein [Burkholderiales bacterium]|nr:NAD-dependent epimerase/dehydratase family protein [Burkholderiales bacterium]
MVKVLITGADGFIGKNLQIKLSELNNCEIIKFTKKANNSLELLADLVAQADFIFHLAGVNRPDNIEEFTTNTNLTAFLCDCIKSTKRFIPLVLSSSTQAQLDNPYGVSKKLAEDELLAFNRITNNPVFIYRLTNVFGKWSRPNYNSAVATFCHNIANDLPITINDKLSSLRLVYIDDVVDSFVHLLNNYKAESLIYQTITPEYNTSVGEVVNIINGFKNSVETGVTLAVGTGLIRALYSTYLSFLPTSKFTYSLVKHEDTRGIFVEMLKTPDSGQFSFFTAHPGITRGGHYHHTKTEKFLVIKGIALYRFRHIITNEYYEIKVSSENPTVVETIPGWSHDITNIGECELIVMLWANEIFDRKKPDTVTFKVE